MASARRRARLLTGVVGAAVHLSLSTPAAAQLDLGGEELVQASGVDIAVPPYSVPTFAHWDTDGLPDLIVGQGSSSGKVRVYLNVGTPSAPLFSSFFYAQSGGSDLVVTGSG